MTDGHEARTCYDSRVAVAERDATWTKPGPLPSSDLPQRVGAATAAQSLWKAEPKVNAR